MPSHDKKIGEEGFDLETEILDQSRQLKISGAEKITDKVIEEKDSKNNNTKIINNGYDTSMVLNIY